ncbi:MAG: hypothetical protein ABJB66_06595 [Gemmatimonadaceae bacterium]
MGLSHWLLFSLVIGLGLQIGAGLYEARVIVPLWIHDAPEATIEFFNPPMRIDAGRRFWMLLTPIVGVLSIANLYFAWENVADTLQLWLFASVASSAVFVVTMAYFVPTLISFATGAQMDQRKLVFRARLWAALNWARALVLVAAWIAALQALLMGVAR